MGGGPAHHVIASWDVIGRRCGRRDTRVVVHMGRHAGGEPMVIEGGGAGGRVHIRRGGTRQSLVVLKEREVRRVN